MGSGGDAQTTEGAIENQQAWQILSERERHVSQAAPKICLRQESPESLLGPSSVLGSARCVWEDGGRDGLCSLEACHHS